MSMKIVFLSNYYNHHQAFLAEAMARQTDGRYRFIETMPMDEERKQLGWSNDNKPDYVLQTYGENADVDSLEKLIFESEYVITAEPWSKLLNRRYKANKVTFHYSERLYKTGCSLPLLLGKGMKYYWYASRHKSMYLLCASAYAAGDYAKTGLYKNRAYRWGYFPEVKEYHLDELMQKKRANDKPVILWAGRMLALKHAEAAINVAKVLKEKGYSFELQMIGAGEECDKLKAQIAENDLESYVWMPGTMSPMEVRGYMEQANIYLFTSDQNEGWGAVLNESMNSACAVVASGLVGSVPYLMEQGVNGYIYREESELVKYVEELLNHRELREKLGRKAYDTMTSLWNADVATERFLKFAGEISDSGSSHLYTDGGPCTKELI